MGAAKDMLFGAKTVKLLEHADLAYTDTQSNYIDRQGWDECVIDVHVSALTGVDGSNYLTPTLQSATASPAASGSYSAVAAADVDTEIVTAAGVSTVSRDTIWVKIDSSSEDSVIYRARYKGTARYLNVLLNYSGTGITAGVVGVVAYLKGCRMQPENTNTPTTGTVT